MSFAKEGDQLVEPEASWDQDVAQKPDEAFVPYDPKAAFAKQTLIRHPVFGKGLVTNTEKGRILVLFQEGPKKLVHTG